MSALPDHKTGFMESEAFMDVLELFDQWQDDGAAPDFTIAQRRLHEAFNLNELRNLEVIAHVLVNLINAELSLRNRHPDFNEPGNPIH